jgi:DNA-binding HxlR family transcriptional regulator
LPACPVATTVGLVGNKWKLLILRSLLKSTKRFGELLREIPDISQKVLTENLKSMEEDGIILRYDYKEVPLKVEYKLSDLGNSLRPIIDVMEQWGKNYQESFKNL